MNKTKDEIKSLFDSILAANPQLTGENTLDVTIRKQIEYCINAVDSTAVVYPYDTLDHKPEEWANLFLINGIANGCVIKRSDFTGEWERQSSYQVSFLYDVWWFYKFNPDPSNPSDLIFQNKIDLLFVLLANLPTLGIEQGIEQHKMLQSKKMDTLNGSTEQMHWNPGKIEVVLCEMQPGTGAC